MLTKELAMISDQYHWGKSIFCALLLCIKQHSARGVARTTRTESISVGVKTQGSFSAYHRVLFKFWTLTYCTKYCKWHRNKGRSCKRRPWYTSCLARSACDKQSVGIDLGVLLRFHTIRNSFKEDLTDFINPQQSERIMHCVRFAQGRYISGLDTCRTNNSI